MIMIYGPVDIYPTTVSSLTWRYPIDLACFVEVQNQELVSHYIDVADQKDKHLALFEKEINNRTDSVRNANRVK